MKTLAQIEDAAMTDVRKLDAMRENLPALWNSMTDKERRKHICGDSYASFKTWENLTEQQKRTIEARVKNAADSAFIVGAFAKALRKNY
jgi:hypothetical protein